MKQQPFDVITFDCYGTLIDWEGGISNAFREAGAAATREEILRHYAQIEPLVEQERYRTYREVLAEVARQIGARIGWTTDGTFLPESLPRWAPFADTNAALERLRAAGYRLGILSNTDDDLIAATRKHFTVDFDLVITAQQVGSYKPAPGHFVTARERIGDARWLHAAQSNFHDIIPTNQMQVPNAATRVANVWINRKDEQALPGGAPSFEYPDMASFAAAFAS
jgi:2-haloalkanoic acid dehalogenase type II